MVTTPLAKTKGFSKPKKEIKTTKPTSFKRFLRDNIGFLFIVIWLIGFIIFKVFPLGSSLYWSFTDYRLMKPITTHGFDNYVKIFTDGKIMKSIGITFTYTFITVPLKLIAALFIAYILNFKIKGVNFFRTAYYIPSILGGSVAISVLWLAIFRDEGVVNMMLSFLGIEGPKWISDPNYALFVISLLRVWQFGSAMVIFLAALRGVPQDLYEAATIDGAGKWRQFFKITVPMITPVIFYNLVTQLIQAFQEFNGPYIITRGGPLGSTTLMSLLMYKKAFTEYKIGEASAIAWIMFIILATLSAVAFISQKKWVYYSDEKG